jgi:hypothetical protein
MCVGCSSIQFGDVQVGSVRGLHGGAVGGGAPLRDSERRLCSNMVQSLRENDRYNQSPLLLFGAVQEGVGFDRLQTLFYYLKLPPDTPFLVCLTTSHVVSPSCLRFVARVVSGAGEDFVSPAHFVAMSPAVIVRSGVAISWDPPVAPFLMVQSSVYVAFLFVVAGKTVVEGVNTVSVAPTVSHGYQFCGGGIIQGLNLALACD